MQYGYCLRLCYPRLTVSINAAEAPPPRGYSIDKKGEIASRRRRHDLRSRANVRALMRRIAAERCADALDNLRRRGIEPPDQRLDGLA